MLRSMAFVLILFWSSSCAIWSKKSEPTIEAKKETLFFSSRTEPSIASGDCSGYSLWLEKAGDSVEEAYFFEHEGSCGYHKQEVMDLKFDAETQTVKFNFKSSPEEVTSQYFEFKIEGEKADGFSKVSTLENINSLRKVELFKQDESQLPDGN